MDKFTNSVYLDKDLCKGCINCIKRCPTEAIRVRDGKAVITKEFCIDCGECIRICPHHAKRASYDHLDMMNDFTYKIALPAPSLFGQFNNLEDPNIVLTGLMLMGFDAIMEVGQAAELVSQMSRRFIDEHKDMRPLISTACPSVVRLIRVRFPNLLEHLLPVIAPVDLAARMARERAIKETGLPSEQIGVFFISPCPAKATAVHSPLGIEKSDIDAVLAIKEVYPILSECMKEASHNVQDISQMGRIGLSWGSTGGEAGGLLSDSYLAADGIENVIKVLEDLEDQKINDLEFIELNACYGGCVGGVLNVENPFVAKAKMEHIRKYMPVARNRVLDVNNEFMWKCLWKEDVTYEPVFHLGMDMKDSIIKVGKVRELEGRLPGLDCGACGAPTCKALAEDVIRGVAKESDCIHILRELYKEATHDDCAGTIE